MRDANIKGGSGYAEATVGDMGFAKTNGIETSGMGESSVLVTNTRKRKTKKEGGVLSLANIETDPRGDPPIAQPLEKNSSNYKPRTAAASKTTKKAFSYC